MRRSDRGSALIEVAIVLPILLVITIGMMDFGRAFYQKSLLDQAAREGCRLAVVTAPDVALVQTRVTDLLDAGGMTPKGVINVVGPGPDHMVTVTVQADYTFMTPGIFTLFGGGFGNTLTMTGKSTMRFEG